MRLEILPDYYTPLAANTQTKEVVGPKVPILTTPRIARAGGAHPGSLQGGEEMLRLLG